MTTKIDIELVDGKIIGIYSNNEDVEINIIENLGVELTDEQEYELEFEIASVPYILCSDKS